MTKFQSTNEFEWPKSESPNGRWEFAAFLICSLSELWSLELGPWTRSVPEVPLAGKDHRRAGSICGVDCFLIPHRAAGLDDRAHAGIEQELRAVGEWKESVAGGDGAFGALACFFDRESGRADAI